VTEGLCQIKDVTIYGQFMFESAKNVVMGESNTLQLINFFSITVKQRGAFH